MKAKGRRCCIILLALVVLLACSAMTAYGAKKKKTKKKVKAKTKTVQVVASESNTWTTQSAIRTNSGTYNKVYRYNKDGVCTGYTNNEGTTSYTLNAAGFITEEVTKAASGAMKYRTLYTRDSNGDPTQIIYYENRTGFSKPARTETYTYYGKGAKKTRVAVDYEGGTITTTYDIYGNITEEIMQDSREHSKSTYTNILDSHHNPIKITERTEGSSGNYDTSSTSVTDITYQYDKSGNITKSDSKMSTVYSYGDTETITKTSTAAYNKKGNPIKKSFYSKSVGNAGYEFIDTDNITIKYKNVKVPKKYWHLYDD